jgi:hypothetical protein
MDVMSMCTFVIAENRKRCIVGIIVIVIAVVVKQWSKKAESPSSTFRHTSRGIQREFVRQSGSGSVTLDASVTS